MAVLAIVGTSFGIYGILYYERSSSISIELLTNSPVFDIRTDISQLEISYSGVDLRKSAQSLRLVTVKILNNGEKHISKSEFEEGDPISIVVNGGKIVEISRHIASNDFLQKRGKLKLLGDNRIQLDPVLLERNESITSSFLVLSEPDVIPTVIATGKVAGVKNIEFIDNSVIKKDSLFKEIFYADSLLVQILRPPAYVIFFFIELFLLIVAIIIPFAAFDSISTAIKRWSRQQRVHRKFFGRTLLEAEQVCLSYYIDYGKPGLSHLFKLLKRIEERERIIHADIKSKTKGLIKRKLRKIAPISPAEVKFLAERDLIAQNGLHIEISADFEQSLRNICRNLDLKPEDIENTFDNSRYGSINSPDIRTERFMLGEIEYINHSHDVDEDEDQDEDENNEEKADELMGETEIEGERKVTRP